MIKIIKLAQIGVKRTQFLAYRIVYQSGIILAVIQCLNNGKKNFSDGTLS